MRNNEIVKKLKKIKFKEGIRTKHYTIWNCPCMGKNHPVNVGNQPSKECYFQGFKKQLDIHYKDFGKI